MTILNSDHLFDQADKLVTAPIAGSPRQVDLRRAISAAYHGLFHYIMTALADGFVGATQRTTKRYTLVYRSIDHRTLRDICLEAQKQSQSQRYAAYLPSDGFGVDIQAFAAAMVDLQRKRHRADYDPEPRFRTSDAQLAIETARSAMRLFRDASREPKRAFLTLLLCPPR